MRLLISLLLVLSIGCSSLNSNEYIEGTALTIGLYIPYNGSIYGIQALNYISGKKIKVSNTNDFPSIKSTHSITNSTFGVFSTVGTSKMSIN